MPKKKRQASEFSEGGSPLTRDEFFKALKKIKKESPPKRPSRSGSRKR